MDIITPGRGARPGHPHQHGALERDGALEGRCYHVVLRRACGRNWCSSTTRTFPKLPIAGARKTTSKGQIPTALSCSASHSEPSPPKRVRDQRGGQPPFQL